jgi:hypothetical protein
MSYRWLDIYQREDQYTDQIKADVLDHVLKYFGHCLLEELDRDQIEQISDFADRCLDEYDVMQHGYRHLIQAWFETRSVK